MNWWYLSIWNAIGIAMFLGCLIYKLLYKKYPHEDSLWIAGIIATGPGIILLIIGAIIVEKLEQ